jgi:multidrug resistance efflux pump
VEDLEKSKEEAQAKLNEVRAALEAAQAKIEQAEKEKESHPALSLCKSADHFYFLTAVTGERSSYAFRHSDCQEGAHRRGTI